MYYFFKENLLNKTKYENLDLTHDVHLEFQHNTNVGNVIACEVEILTDEEFYQTEYQSKLLTVLDGRCPDGYDYKRTFEVRIASNGDKFSHLDRHELSTKIVTITTALTVLAMPFLIESDLVYSAIKICATIPILAAINYVTNSAIDNGIFDSYLHQSIYDTAILCMGPAIEGNLSYDC